MGKIESIKNEIKSLNRDELTVLRSWFVEYDSSIWDREIESDAESGKLADLADAAIEAYESGETREL